MILTQVSAPTDFCSSKLMIVTPKTKFAVLSVLLL